MCYWVPVSYRYFKAIDLLYRNQYPGYYSFEWEKLWHPEILDPQIALADYPVAMRKHFDRIPEGVKCALAVYFPVPSNSSSNPEPIRAGGFEHSLNSLNPVLFPTPACR